MANDKKVKPQARDPNAKNDQLTDSDWSKHSVLLFLANVASPIGICLLTGLLALFALLAWQEAMESTRIARDTAQKQLRAYLVVESLKLIPKTNGEYEVSITVQNMGQTPAHDVRLSLAAALREYPLTTDIPSEGNLGHELYLGKNATFSDIPTKRFDENKIYQIDAGDDPRLYVRGHLYYRDIYEREWHLNFCYMYLGKSQVSFGACKEFNNEELIEAGGQRANYVSGSKPMITTPATSGVAPIPQK